MEPFVKKANPEEMDEVIRSICDTIRIRGFSGTEKERAEYLKNLCLQKGFNSAGTDRMGNLIAEMKFGSAQGPQIVLSGHMDTVGAQANEWDRSTQPFDALVKDGKIYGRGAADMLGSVLCMIHSISRLKAASPPGLNGTVYFVGTVCEEFFEGVAFLEALKEIRPDYVIIGEATDLKINIGQRGRAEIAVTAYGRSQHSSTGRNAANAIEEIAGVVEAFNYHYRPGKDPVLGERIIVPTDIKIPVGGGGGLDGRGGNSTVPSRAELTYDVRTLENDSQESIIKLMAGVLKDRKKRRGLKKKSGPGQYPEIKFARDRVTTYTGKIIEQDKFAPAWKMDKKCLLVRKAMEGLRKAGFSRIGLGAYKFCTDGSALYHYKKQFPGKNVEIIGFGPGKESYAHIINEFIEIKAVDRAVSGLTHILNELLQ